MVIFKWRVRLMSAIKEGKAIAGDMVQSWNSYKKYTEGLAVLHNTGNVCSTDLDRYIHPKKYTGDILQEVSATYAMIDQMSAQPCSGYMYMQHYTQLTCGWGHRGSLCGVSHRPSTACWLALALRIEAVAISLASTIPESITTALGFIIIPLHAVIATGTSNFV